MSGIKFMAGAWVLFILAVFFVCILSGCSTDQYDGYEGWYRDYLVFIDCRTDYECEVAEQRLCQSYPESDPLDMQELVCD